jgi:UDP-N-acetylglucosamine 1-carboxyvinyltransferase
MRISVQGKHPLRGHYTPSGNSNAALAVVVASTLSEQPMTLRNVPDTLSTSRVLESARALGATVQHQRDRVLIQTAHLQTRVLDAEMTNALGASILFLAPLLLRRGYVRVEWRRSLSRLRPHIQAMQDLGLRVDIAGNDFEVRPERWEERDIMLLFPSVTTTALVCMLAAAFGQKTTIRNAASEPHLRILQHALVQLGAKIDGIGSNLVTVYGMQSHANAVDVSLPSDHIEIASLAAISAVTPGQIDIQDVYLPDMQMILQMFGQLGVQYYTEQQPNSDLHVLHIPEQHQLAVARPLGDTTLSIDTNPWPGFPSDLVAIATLLASQARGSTLIHEKLFSDRLLFVDKLKSMGARIVLCDPHRAVVFGKSPLRGEYIDSPDVRVGLALLGAALAAEGESVIDNAHLVEWAFEGITGKLTRLGAHIEADV